MQDYNPAKSELIKHNKAKTYVLQQGAAQGTSICKPYLYFYFYSTLNY